MTFLCSNCSGHVSPFAEACCRCGQHLHPLTAEEVSEMQHEQQRWQGGDTVSQMGLMREAGEFALCEA